MGWFSDEYLQQLRDEQERYRRQSPGDWRLAADPMSVQRIENTLRMGQWQREGNVQAITQYEAAQAALSLGGGEGAPAWANLYLSDEYLQTLLDEMVSYKQMYGADWEAFVDPMVAARINKGVNQWYKQRTRPKEGGEKGEREYLDPNNPMRGHLEAAFRQPEPSLSREGFDTGGTAKGVSNKFGQLPRLSEREKAQLLSHRTEPSMFDAATILTNAGINENHAWSIHGWATMGRDILMAMINAKGSFKEAICALHPQLNWLEDGDLDKASRQLAAHYGVPATDDLFSQLVGEFSGIGVDEKREQVIASVGGAAETSIAFGEEDYNIYEQVYRGWLSQALAMLYVPYDDSKTTEELVQLAIDSTETYWLGTERPSILVGTQDDTIEATYLQLKRRQYILDTAGATGVDPAVLGMVLEREWETKGRFESIVGYRAVTAVSEQPSYGYGQVQRGTAIEMFELYPDQFPDLPPELYNDDGSYNLEELGLRLFHDEQFNIRVVGVILGHNEKIVTHYVESFGLEISDETIEGQYALTNEQITQIAVAAYNKGLGFFSEIEEKYTTPTERLDAIIRTYLEAEDSRVYVEGVWCLQAHVGYTYGIIHSDLEEFDRSA